jgi:hypothetical protein
LSAKTIVGSSSALYKAVFMMQAAEHRPLHNSMASGKFVPVAAVRNVGLDRFRKSRA